LKTDDELKPSPLNERGRGLSKIIRPDFLDSVLRGKTGKFQKNMIKSVAIT
jgi:hypothetical protein